MNNGIPQNKLVRYTSDDLHDVIEMYLEYVYKHGYDGEAAKSAAVREIIEGREAEMQMVAIGEILPTLEYRQCSLLEHLDLS